MNRPKWLTDKLLSVAVRIWKNEHSHFSSSTRDAILLLIKVSQRSNHEITNNQAACFIADEIKNLED